MEITRGSLDDISRPPSNANRQRPGSRVSLNSAGSSSSYRFNLNTESSLEILPPEDISQEAHDIEVQELYSSDEDLQGIQNGGFNHHRHQLVLSLQNNESVHDTASLDPDDNLSNTEKASEGGVENDAETDDANSVTDPKIAEAMRKMRQLDRILAKKVKREKEVKRQRLELHRQLQRELDGVKPEGRDELREVSDNTSKFLALIPPNSHNEGVEVEDDLPSRSPVFATQPLDNDGAARNSGRSQGAHDTNSTDGDSTNRSVPRSGRDDSAGNGRKGSKKNKKSKGKRSHDDKNDNKDNFIRRNIELATDAGNVIAMTDDEKKRLEELLQEVEMLHDDEEEEATSLASHNQLQLAPGVGYLPDADEHKMLQNIDAKLMALMPSKDFMSICSSPIQDSVSNGFSEMSLGMFDLGEKVLQDTKQARSQQERLQNIEDELTRMQNTVEQEIKSPRISNARLAEILRQCDDLSSRATSEASSYMRSSTSPRNSHTETSDTAIVEVVPKLPDDVLRHLLDEAKEAGITSSRSSGGIATNRSLSTVNEGEEEEEDLESEAYTERSSEAGALVSYDMIQELLKNPRATSVASTTQAIEYPSRADQGSSGLPDDRELTSARDSANGDYTPPSPRNVSSGDDSTPRAVGRMRTPVSQSPRSTGSALRESQYSVEPQTDMTMISNNKRYLQNQRPPTNVDRISRNNRMSSYDREYAHISESGGFMNSDDLMTRFENASLEIRSPEESSVQRLLKTRGSSRIAFAETAPNSQLHLSVSSNRTFSRADHGGDMGRPFRIPTPPQAAQSLSSPRKSKPPPSSRSKKSKSRASSRRKSPSQTGPSPEGDIRVESVSASASYSSITSRTDSQASTNTLVSSSDFEYENDDEVQEQVLRATPGDTNGDGTSRRVISASDDGEEVAAYSQAPPRLHQSMRRNKPKPVLPVDKQKIHGIDSYAKSDDDSDKPFSPVFF